VTLQDFLQKLSQSLGGQSAASVAVGSNVSVYS
jgi:hypothetical protein